MNLQQLTTLPNVTDRWLVSIEPILEGERRAYRVTME
jgi:hypothetical protein